MRREEILRLLQKGEEAFFHAIAAARKDEETGRGGTGWTPLECAEHVVMVEEVLLAKLEAAPVAEGAAQNPERERAIAALGARRSRKFEAPESVRPTGRFSNFDQAEAAFRGVRRRTLALLSGIEPLELQKRSAVHAVLGDVNGLELILLIAVHPARHAEQMREWLEGRQPSL